MSSHPLVWFLLSNLLPQAGSLQLHMFEDVQRESGFIAIRSGLACELCNWACSACVHMPYMLSLFGPRQK